MCMRVVTEHMYIDMSILMLPSVNSSTLAQLLGLSDSVSTTRPANKAAEYVYMYTYKAIYMV